MLQKVISITIAIITLSACACCFASPLPFSAALYYATDPPVDELKAFDIVVVDPDSGLTPDGYGAGPSQLFAYVSVGEAAPERAYTREMDPHWFMGENRAWNSRVIDVSNPAWRQFFVTRVVEPLWRAGFRGFFLDTLDSYQLSARKEDLAAMEAGMVELIRSINRLHPGARLILNRGFEIFDRVKDVTYAVAAESLYQGFTTANGRYGDVTDNDRKWLLEKLNVVKAAGIPVIAIDYVPPGKRELARQTADRIKALGFVPWVTDKDLAGLGVGAVEVMPRKIIGLIDGSEGDDVTLSELHRLGVMPLNYLGYQVEMHDLGKPLPRQLLAGRYAGVVVWPYSSRSGELQGLKRWVARCVAEGVPVVFLDRLGMPMDNELLKLLGLGSSAATGVRPPLRIMHQDALIGFEHKPLPRVSDFMPLKLQQGKVLLQVAAANGLVSDAVAITPWGGYALYPFAVYAPDNERSFWVVDPFRFFKEALRLPDMPVPDTTTENGTRLLLSHVDGDGFESVAEWPGGRISAIELKERVLLKYRFPIAISLITGVTAANGLYPQKSAEFERVAREIFKLDWVEGASHSFSHPFKWRKLSEGDMEADYSLKISGYRFSIRDEIDGSVRNINRLMPPGKSVRLFFWTGDCTPGADAIEAAYKAGVGNMNSGDTLITETNRTVTSVAPLGVSKNGWFQVFAPNQNENVYTNNWTGPFYGYQRVIETFRLTDSPRRLKPVNIYYHFYSASKQASLNALKRVYDWAQGQRLFSIFASEYFDKVLDYNRTVVARDGAGWLVRNNGQLRQMRIPQGLGYPDLEKSRHLAGFSDHGAVRYLHLAPGGEARIQLSPAPPAVPYLVTAGATLQSFERHAKGLRMKLRGYAPFTVSVGRAAGCSISGAGRGVKKVNNSLRFELPEGVHALTLNCR